MNFNEVYLGLGSNLGNRKQNLRIALLQLKKFLFVNKISSFYQTKAIGPLQRNFFNLVVQVSTNLSPITLLLKIKNLEKKMGRKTSFFWGPRLIDIDIIKFNEIRISTRYLTVPHKQLFKRRFVLEPFYEIAGNIKMKNKNLLFYLNQTMGQYCEKI